MSWRKYNWYQMAELFEELGIEVREGVSRTEMKKLIEELAREKK